jgi:hypothetical protein
MQGYPCCAAEGCSKPVEKFKWYCKGHYFSLPDALRGDLWRNWRAAMACYRQPVPQAEQLRRNSAYGQAFRNCQDHLRTVRETTASAMTTVAFDAREFAEKRIEGGAPKAFRYVGGRML